MATELTGTKKQSDSLTIKSSWKGMVIQGAVIVAGLFGLSLDPEQLTTIIEQGNELWVMGTAIVAAGTAFYYNVRSWIGRLRANTKIG